MDDVPQSMHRIRCPSFCWWYIGCSHIFIWHVISFMHYNDVIVCALASQITSLAIVYSTVYSRRRSKKTSKLRVTGLCTGNSPVTGAFSAHTASYAENGSAPFDDVIISLRITSQEVLVRSYDCNSISDIIVKNESIINSQLTTIQQNSARALNAAEASHEYKQGMS